MLRNLNQSFSGSRICGTPHVGVLASEILTGITPPSLLENDIDVGDPVGCEYRMRIIGERPVGVIQFDLAENGTYIFDAPDGTYTYTQIVSKNSVDAAPSSLVFQIGVATSSVSGDVAVSYLVESSTTVISSDFTAAYQVVVSVSSDLNVGFQALNLVSADTSVTYTIQTVGEVSSSLAATYSVFTVTPVFNSVVVSYTVLSDIVANVLIATVSVRRENRIVAIKADPLRVVRN